MDPIRFIQHEGRSILLIDYNALDDEERVLERVQTARAFLDRIPPNGSLLTLTDVRGTAYTKRTVAAMREFAAQNKPWVRAAAVVAGSTAHRVAISSAALFTRRKIRAFDHPAAALEWLLQQQGSTLQTT